MLGKALSHDYVIPMSQAKRGLAYLGSNYRLRAVVRDLLTGQRPVHIGVIGGSISWGQGASVRGITDWVGVFSQWVIGAFPQANITVRNGCVPGTPSSYMIMCLELSVDPEVDVVFVEYVINDGCCGDIVGNKLVMAYERLIRRVLQLPNRPAVILMQVPYFGLASPPGTPEWNPFYQTIEDLYGSVAQYYDLQYLSMRTALYRLSTIQQIEGYRWPQLMADINHPADMGHHVMGDLAVWLFQSTAIDLVLNPFGQEDLEQLQEPIPPPMYPGNLPPENAMCLYQDTFKTVVTKAEGFTFLNEGTEDKPKKGYVSTTVGSVMEVVVYTLRPRLQTMDPVTVCFAYLRSYHKMGSARFECVSGCTCAPKVYDANHVKKVSQLYMAELSASQSEKCTVRITTLPESTSGGHKFKVAGVVVSELAGEGSRENFKEGEWGATFSIRKDYQIAYDKKGAHIADIGDPDVA